MNKQKQGGTSPAKTEKQTINDRWEIYKDHEGHWRWIRSSSNGNIVGISTDGCTNKADCEENARQHGWEGYGSAS